MTPDLDKLSASIDQAEQDGREALDALRKHLRQLATEAKQVKELCKRVTLHKETADDLEQHIRTAAEQAERNAPQANGRPPDESAGESVDEGHLKEVKKARAS